MTDPVPSKVPGPQDPRPPGCRCGDNFDPKCPAGHSNVQRPSKDEVWSDARIFDELGDYDPSLSRRDCEQIFKQALGMIHRLQTALRGIQSCSTCEACRGAATRALAGGVCVTPPPRDGQ